MTATPTPSARSRRRWPRLLVALGLLLALGWALLLSPAPSVPPRPRPTAAEIAAGRAAVARLRAARAIPGQPVTLDPTMLGGLVALASDASGRRHVAARIDDGVLTGTASLRSPLGWLNVAASVSGAHKGFPALDVTVGRVRLPHWASRAGAEVGHWVLRRRGATLPPLDEMVRALKVDPASVTVSLALPDESRLVDSALKTSSGVTVDPVRTAALACRLVAAQKRLPAMELAEQVRRAFAGAEATPDGNRAALVALALLIVPERAPALFPGAAERSAACGVLAGPPVLLHGRADLAKHWALSAALGATFGDAAGRALGEWKELADSDGGSGFSFVDLAADRAGLRTAAAATDPDAAAATAARLAGASEEALMPVRLTDAPEGMTETEFRARYGALDTRRYEAALRVIDRELAKTGL